MSAAEEDREQRAAVAAGDELFALLQDPSPRVVQALLENRNLTEEDVLVIAARKNLPGEVLDMIARDRRWTESYPVRLALAKNPKTPLFSSLSIVRYLRLFDQAELTRSVALPLVFRRKVEAIIIEKIPTMPLGVRKSLAKIAAGAVLLRLVQDGIPDVVSLCLNNPHLVEAHLYKVINREDTRSSTIRLIASHPSWSNRAAIRYALARNEHTPLARAVRFLADMRTQDLREISVDPVLSESVRSCALRELDGRTGRAAPAEAEEPYIEMSEDECGRDDQQDIEQAIDALDGDGREAQEKGEERDG